MSVLLKSLDAGVLTLTLPKKPESEKSRQIKIA